MFHYRKNTNFTFVLALSSFVNSIMSYEIDFKTKRLDSNHVEVNANIKLNPNESLYSNSFKISSNSPNFIVTNPKSDKQPTTFFDNQYKAQKQGFKDNVTFTFIVEKKPESLQDQTILTVHLKTNDLDETAQELVSIDFNQNKNQKTEVIDSDKEKSISLTQQSTPTACAVPQPSLAAGFTTTIKKSFSSWATNSKEWLVSLFQTTGSRWLRFLIVFLIGILLSLTPCIYPMIPITVGVLQANQTKSAVRGFLLALAYTFGISTTFAIFGLIATLTSCVFGELQGSIWLVLPIAILLFYFGFSMLGAYELYIPKFLRPKAHNVKGGSIVSAYTFGIISGSVASPCLSSGLIFVLNYVTTLTAIGTIWGYIEGLLLLFAFGVGSSLPLLIIGTFSTSLNMLPKAGMWMVEVNKIIGLLLIGMGFYHVSNLERWIPWQILVFVIAAFLLGAGIYYLLSTSKHDSAPMRFYKILVSIILIVAGSITAVHGVKYLYTNEESVNQTSYWLSDYADAANKSKIQNKLLFIDIGATYCGACHELDKEIFSKDEVKQVLTEAYIPLKIEADLNPEDYKTVKQQFSNYIKGYPTYLIVKLDEKDKPELIKHWSVDLADYTTEEIVKLFEEIASKQQ